MHRNDIYDYYKKALGDLEGFSFILMPDRTFSNCWLTAIQLDKAFKIKPLDIMLALEADYVESRPVWNPMHMQPICHNSEDRSKNESRFVQITA